MKKITSFDRAKESNKKEQLPVFGIDLGTTNSAISLIANGSVPITIPLKDGRMTMPSCVMWKDSVFIVGSEAYIHRGEANCIYSVKRFMQDRTKQVVLRDGDSEVILTPAEVSSKILLGLIEETDRFYGEVKNVVVTVPAYFDQNGVTATREACELAGLNLVAIANEPTAASLCYDLNPIDEGVKDVIVYDLGGGTFDVTLTRISGGSSADNVDELANLYGISTNKENKVAQVGSRIVTTLSIDGDMQLGGDDIDQELLRILYSRLRENGINPDNFTVEYKEKLILRLEQHKKEGINFIYDIGIKTFDVHGNLIQTAIRIEPKDFMDATRFIYNKTRFIVNRLLRGVSNNAETIVLVGGSTKNRYLVEMLKEDFPSFVIDDALNPDLSVSNGASIQGKIKEFGDESIQIFDILPITIGILDGDKVTPLIRKGTALPTVATTTYTTVADGQTDLSVKVFQGNSTSKSECIELGILKITGIKERAAGEPVIVITVSISADRLMKCKVDINGISKELLLNLAGDTRQSIKLTSEEKRIERWRIAANALSPQSKYELLQLIDNYPTSVKRETIVEFIQVHRDKLASAKEMAVNEG